MIRLHTLFLAVLLSLLYSCEQDPIEPGNFDTEKNKQVNQWVFQNMNNYYLWKNVLPTNIDNLEREDPRSFFDKMLYYDNNIKYDKWSLIVSDHKQWIKELEGKSAATGANLGFFTFGGSQVFAIVYYVDKGSPAEKQGLKRGDAILAVNGEIPYTNNFAELFFGEGPYEYTMGKIEDNVVDETGIKITVTPTEFQKDPILVSKVFDRNGKKIAYLAYTSFLDDFNEQLSAVFSDFKNQGAEALVLDLRYNSGGSGNAATHLASLIAPSSAKGRLFFSKNWNEDLNNEFDALIAQDPANLYLRSENFTNLAENMNLNTVHVITTNWSASASELVISGLEPYMDVVQIGQDTHGKFTGSITLSDEQELHPWAIQPIVFQYANAVGLTEFWNGLAADITADDDFTYTLGDDRENLLNIALSQAANLPTKKRSSALKFGVNINYENNMRLKGGILTDDTYREIILK